MKASPSQFPTRTCLGCRARRPQPLMRRLALVSEEGRGARVVWDAERALGGRGAWLCADDPGCLGKALRKKNLARAFRLETEPDAADLPGPRLDGGRRP